MNFPNRFPKSGILGVVFFLALGSAASAQSRNQPMLLSMSVHTERSEYWLGEPVELVARIVNWHTPLAEISGIFGLKGDQTQLRIVHDGEMGGLYKGYYTPEVLMSKKIPVKYGKAHEFRILVAGDKETLPAFPWPGPRTFPCRRRLVFGTRWPPRN